MTLDCLKVRTPASWYGHEAPDDSIGNETGEHCWAAYVCSTARSGIPTAVPVWSLHCSAGFMLSRNNAVVPTSASEFVQAVVIAFCASSPLNFESAALTTT